MGAGVSMGKDDIAEAVRQAAPANVKPVKGVRVNRDVTVGLPQDCPVQPLGMNNGVYFYLDANKQLRSLPAGKHRGTEIFALFGKGAEQFLYDNFPRYSKPDHDGKVTVNGWKSEMVGQRLMEDCAAQGILDLSEAVRGAGSWRDGDALVMHCGDVVYRGVRSMSPQKIGAYIYPADSKKQCPAEQARKGAAQDLLKILQSWHWARPDIDPMLMLGWIGAAMLGGALVWRPMVWVTGDKGTGKSTLQKLVKDVFGRGGLILAVDASAAGLWQSLGYSSLPVALDEVEAEEDNRRNNNLIKLARVAASGGQVLRGGSDHKQASFTLRSCFLFSSILIPPMLGQDVSRMARLELRPLAKGAAMPRLEERILVDTGAIFRRRLLDQWPRFDDTLMLYREAMRKAGHGGRGQDQFGSLLACADILLRDSLPDTNTLEGWAGRMNVDVLHETANDVADWERCAAYLLSSFIDPYRSGSKKTVAQWVSEAAGYKHGDEVGANDVLASHGLKIFKKEGQAFLRVATAHRALSKLFEGSQWAGRAGASGVWACSLRRAEGAENLSGIRFSGAKVQVVQIPLDQIISKMEDNYEN